MRNVFFVAVVALQGCAPVEEISAKVVVSPTYTCFDQSSSDLGWWGPGSIDDKCTKINVSRMRAGICFNTCLRLAGKPSVDRTLHFERRIEMAALGDCQVWEPIYAGMPTPRYEAITKQSLPKWEEWLCDERSIGDLRWVHELVSQDPVGEIVPGPPWSTWREVEFDAEKDLPRLELPGRVETLVDVGDLTLTAAFVNERGESQDVVLEFADGTILQALDVSTAFDRIRIVAPSAEALPEASP